MEQLNAELFDKTSQLEIKNYEFAKFQKVIEKQEVIKV